MTRTPEFTKVPLPRNLLESLLRRFSQVSYTLLVLVVYGLAATALGLAAAPALAMVARAATGTAALQPVAAWVLRGIALAAGWFVFGLDLLVVVALYNWILPTRLRPYRGAYYALEALPWFLHNGLFYLVRFTFLPFVTLTPFGVWFLRAMGMKIGRHAFVNTELISDPAFITIGDDAVVGGSVRLFAHYGVGGKLVIAPVRVGHRATLGVASCLMGDVVVGEDAVILPHSVVLPGSRVGAGETWGGVPARPITQAEGEAFRQATRGGRPGRPPPGAAP